MNLSQLNEVENKLHNLGSSIAERITGNESAYDKESGRFDVTYPSAPSTNTAGSANSASDADNTNSATTTDTGNTSYGSQNLAADNPHLNATLQNMWDAINSSSMTAGDNITVSKNPEFESIKVGNINISEEGINMGGNTITGLANGGIYQGSTDAVTGDQLWNAYRRIDTIDERVQVVGAHAAALSALHPVPYTPYEPTTFSTGFGMYRNEQSVAVGVFH
ncbi:MAG: hypothetical protein LUG55_03275, partial [Clostridiales bacterium]|nr:hypothetical protein [Clostridiales bacterium]